MMDGPSNFFDLVELAERVRVVLNALTPREEAVIRKRFFEGMSYYELNLDYEVTQKRIIMIETRALRKLRHPTQHRRLLEFLEAYP